MTRLEESHKKCLKLTREHYENFPVARLVSKKLRPHVSAVYAFARYADDISDEGWEDNHAPTPEQRVERMNAYEEQLLACAGHRALAPATDWIFLALRDTIEKYDIPVQLFIDLLDAFRQDCTQLTYQTHEELLDYCRRSANPVGRLILILHNYRDEQRFAQSDSICTALQLANFWQDVEVDIRKDGRIYIPQEDWEKFGVTRDMFNAQQASTALRQCLAFQVERTWNLFNQGKPLAKSLSFPLSLEINLTWHGGTTILRKIARPNFDTLAKRPKLRKLDLPCLLIRSLLR